MDTGWFQLEKTRVPTANDLASLQQNVGDTGALDPPPNWDPVVDAAVVQRHELFRENHERLGVENAFLSTLRPPFFDRQVQELKVERIENLAMWQSYIVKRQTICYRETGHVANEQSDKRDDIQAKAIERFERKWLFHGSTHLVLHKILQQGFNRSFCGRNACAYGKGVYFARDACYSASPLYSVPDSQGRLGEYCRGKVSQR